MRIRVLTAVWGAVFAERLVRFTLPSLAAPGNLIDLAKRHDVTYEIHAPADDIERIKRQPIFAELSKAVTVQFRSLSSGAFDATNAMAHWDIWSAAVERARADDVYVVLAAPDQVFARGTFLRWAELLERGYLAVFCAGYQVVLETFAEDIEKRFPEGVPIDLSTSQLHALILRHLHPIMIAMFRDSPRWIPHPEWHLRASPGQGVAQRILASHAYAFNPSRIRMTENFCPTEKFDRVAFEPSSFLGVEPFLKQLGYYLRPWRMDDVTLSYYGVWADQYIRQANLIENAIAYTIPIGAPLADKVRRRLQLGGDFYIGQMQASRALVRIWRTLLEAGLYKASGWLAAAHLHCRLRRRLPMRGPVTLFVPADDVLERLENDEAQRLLSADRGDLIAAVRAHVSAGHHALSPGDRIAPKAGGTINTVDGRSYEPTAAGSIKILRGPIRIDDVDIYTIDCTLAPLRLKPATAGAMFRRIGRESRRLIQRARRMLLSLLGRHRRLYDLVLRLRESWFANRVDASSPAAATTDPAALALYRRALAMRGLQAMREMCEFYTHAVLGGAAIEFAPRAHIDDLGGIDDATIKNCLAEALRKSPNFSEAWLELGYLSKESGDLAGAMEAFERARALPAVLARSSGQPDLRVVAATELAGVFGAVGKRSADILGLLDATQPQRFAPWRFNLWRARALLELGRVGDALVAFEKCLRWQSPEARISPLLPNDINDIRRAMQGE